MERAQGAMAGPDLPQQRHAYVQARPLLASCFTVHAVDAGQRGIEAVGGIACAVNGQEHGDGRAAPPHERLCPAFKSACADNLLIGTRSQGQCWHAKRKWKWVGDDEWQAQSSRLR